MEFEQLIGTAQTAGLTLGINVLKALAIFFIGRIVARMLANLARRVMTRADMDQTLVRFLGTMLHSILFIFVIIASVNALGVQTASFIAMLGAAGLAIGLALQGSLSNFAAGVLIILFRPYRIGDYIEAGSIAGTVESVEIFTTTLRSPDNKSIYAPNGQIMSGTVINYSAKETRRIDLVVGVSYSDDLDAVQALLEEIIREDERLLTDPAPVVAVLEMADSSINFVVRPWVKTSDYWAVRFALTKRIKQRFDEAGISIPFPQRDVHLYSHAEPQSP